MAEHLLCLLFVTSSSRGRNVFRYPPQAAAPGPRLTQPIYPSATYTATDTAVQPKRHIHFESTSGGATTASHRVWGDGSSDGTAHEANGHTLGLTFTEKALDYGSDAHETEYETETDSSGDSDLDLLRMKGRRSKDIGLAYQESNTSSARRPFPRTEHNEPDRFDESKYNSALGYSLDFLSDMLTPPRSAGNRKFEICVDELVFIGHPVYIGPDGKWAYPVEPEEDSEVRPTARGRRTKERDSSNQLDTVEEGKEVISPVEVTPRKMESEQGVPTLNMFHLVLIFDKPDPKPAAQMGEGPAPLTLLDEMYREIAFKWAAAAFALQVRDGYIAREAWEMAKLRDKSINDSIPIAACSEMFYKNCSLDRGLVNLYNAIHQLRTKQANPLYAHLPTTITVKLEDLPISMVLSPHKSDEDDGWAHWARRDDLSSSEDEESEVDLDVPAKRMELNIEPWKALLLIDDEAAEQARPVTGRSTDLGLQNRQPDKSDQDPLGTPTTTRPSTQSSLEEDEGLLMRSLIEACDVSKPLLDIAHDLRYDLDGIVIPLARKLVQKKKAILVDVISTRLRTTVLPTTLEEHSSSIEDYSAQFSLRFPSLPSLASFIGTISATPCLMREILPLNSTGNAKVRETYVDALVWLLKQNLVVQTHSRARLFARREVKEAAWRKMWHRRRDRWLRSHVFDESPDQATPIVANSYGSPTDATVPPPRRDQSYMDYDPDLEMDSDLGEGDTAHLGDMQFSVDVAEPVDVPVFGASFIFKPASANKDEARWLRVIRESADGVWASKFDLCVQYLDGLTTFEEISYRTGLHQRELDRILQLFKDDLVTFRHP